MTGKAKANDDSAIVKAPKPICTILSQLGYVLEYITVQCAFQTVK